MGGGEPMTERAELYPRGRGGADSAVRSLPMDRARAAAARFPAPSPAGIARQVNGAHRSAPTRIAGPMSLPSRKPAVDPRMLKLLYFEDLHVGLREVLMKTVMDSDVVGFARLSGDDNPIHLCDVYAAQTRFGPRIAHALYTASLISAALGTRLPGPGAVYRPPTVNFHAPVKIGDVGTIIVEVVELIAEGRRARLN